jgi:serine protease Do
MAPGSSVELEMWRDREAKTIEITLGRLPNERQAQTENQATMPTNRVSHLGLTLAPADEVAGAGDRGLVVTAVDPGSPAADHGFQAGDIILNVDGKPVARSADVREALSEAQGRHDVLMRVKTANATRFVALPLGTG